MHIKALEELRRMKINIFAETNDHIIISIRIKYHKFITKTAKEQKGHRHLYRAKSDGDPCN